MAMTIRPSTDARVIAAQYIEARRQYDAAPATDKILRATLSGRRMGWALQLAEEIAPMLVAEREPSFVGIFRPSNRPAPIEAERGDDRELEARTAAQDAVHREPGVGTIEPRREVHPGTKGDRGNCSRCLGIGRLDDRGFQLVGQPYFDTQACSACGGTGTAPGPDTLPARADEEVERELAVGGVR